jgi:hypothetical protein
MANTDSQASVRISRPEAIREAQERLVLLRKMQRCLEKQKMAPADEAKLKRINWQWFPFEEPN